MAFTFLNKRFMNIYKLNDNINNNKYMKEYESEEYDSEESDSEESDSEESDSEESICKESICKESICKESICKESICKESNLADSIQSTIIEDDIIETFNNNIMTESSDKEYLENLRIDLLIEQDLLSLNKAYNFLEFFFKPFFDIEKNDKIGLEIENNIKEDNKFSQYINYKVFNYKLYLDKYVIYQSISRWYYNQKRTNIFQKLDNIFEEYNLILNKININKNLYYNRNIVEYQIIYNKFNTINNILIIKLNILKKTYNDMTINLKIDQYLDFLSLSL